jgi:putative endonuclease
MPEFFVYILFSSKLNRFYIGTTDDVNKRLEQHNSVFYHDAFSAKGIPWNLFLTINGLHSKQALNIEKHIKAMKSKTYINNLLKYPELIEKLKSRYK